MPFEDMLVNGKRPSASRCFISTLMFLRLQQLKCTLKIICEDISPFLPYDLSFPTNLDYGLFFKVLKRGE